MKNAGGVRGRQRVRDLHRVLQPVTDAQPASSDHVGERRAGDVLHRDEVDAVVLPDVVDRDDVRMIQGGGGSCLLNEALPTLAVDRAHQAGAA